MVAPCQDLTIRLSLWHNGQLKPIMQAHILFRYDYFLNVSVGFLSVLLRPSTVPFLHFALLGLGLLLMIAQRYIMVFTFPNLIVNHLFTAI